MRNIKTIFGLILAIGFAAGASVCEAAKSPKVQMFGPTGIYGTLDKNTIKVTKVDGPAKDKIKPGMVIVGAGGANFKEHVRRELADAIDIAETKAAGGKLTLILKGGNKLDLTLEVLGTYSDTAPYNCPKSAKILERAKISGSGKIATASLAGMAKKDAVATVAPQQAPEIGKLLVSRDELKPSPGGYYVWTAGYQLIAQCEGYLINPNPGAFKSIRTTALNFAAGQNGVGIWGHKLVVPETGRLRGYGEINQPSLTAFIGMLMAKKCGVQDPLLHDAIERTYAYFATYVGHGAMNYGVHGPNTKTFNNNGSSATAAIAMALYGDQEGARFFSQLSAASYNGLESGHASYYFNVFWTPLGVAVGGPELTSAFFKKARWLYTMYRRWDGTFTVDLGYSLPGSTLVMPYTLAKRSLLITGRDADESIWSKGKAATDAVEMGAIDYASKSTDELVALMGNPFPQVRRGAGWALQHREDYKPDIEKLLAEGNKYQKMHALSFVGYPKPKETGLAQLDNFGAVLLNTEEDPEVRAMAGSALAYMGKPAKKYYMDIVRMIAEQRPSDGLGGSVSSLVQIASGMSGTPFADGLVTDKQAHYKAALKMMKHPLDRVRGYGAQMLVGMPLEDFDKVADALLYLIEDKDRTHATYGPGPAGLSVKVLASLNIREGLEFTRKIENTPNAKAGGILRTIWSIWSAYGANAKGELERFRKKNNNRTNWGRLNRIYYPMVKAVEEDRDPPKLISLEEARRAGRKGLTGKPVAVPAVPRSEKWTPAQALAWQAKQPWYVGCNFIPSTAINQLEMWQADTFDPATIDRELGWAKGIGMNCARVYLHDLAYQQDPEGFLKRIDLFLKLADRHGIKTLLVIFDDCWFPDPKIGKQPVPIPSVHNSGWLKSPGMAALKAAAAGNDGTRARLEKYVKAVLTRFANDGRVMAWDLYNEPANKVPADQSDALLKLSFAWAWEVNPSQPLTSGVYSNAQPVKATQLANSDIITFHTYSSPEKTVDFMDALASQCDRPPFLCTEFMARPRGSTFEGCLPVFKQRNVGAICWGLVRGKTNTIWGWGTKQGAPEPKVWFHDVFLPDGTPYKPVEIDAIHQNRKTPIRPFAWKLSQ